MYLLAWQGKETTVVRGGLPIKCLACSVYADEPLHHNDKRRAKAETCDQRRHGGRCIELSQATPADSHVYFE